MDAFVLLPRGCLGHQLARVDSGVSSVLQIIIEGVRTEARGTVDVSTQLEEAQRKTIRRRATIRTLL